MKGILIPALVLLASVTAAAQTGSTGKKIFAVYFSWGGNTRSVAQEIQRQAGAPSYPADMFEIKTVNSYPAEYRPTTEVAKREQDANARPALATQVTNMRDYDVVFIGYPNWWGTLPMALFTFLETYDLSGKTVIPFCTHEGSRFGQSLQDLQKLCPRSPIFEGFTVRGSGAKSAGNDITAWLRKIGMVQ
jgi:flavodoxin